MSSTQIPVDLFVSRIFPYLDYHEWVGWKRTSIGCRNLHRVYTFYHIRDVVLPLLKDTGITVDQLYLLVSYVTPHHPLPFLIEWLLDKKNVLTLEYPPFPSPRYECIDVAYQDIHEDLSPFLYRYATHALYLHEYKGNIPDAFRDMPIHGMNEMIEDIKEMSGSEKKWLMASYRAAIRFYADDQRRVLEEELQWHGRWGYISRLMELKRRLRRNT
jgi:hypothetical protein